MTNLEAIEVIKDMATDLSISFNSPQGQALIMAIEALQTQYLTNIIRNES